MATLYLCLALGTDGILKIGPNKKLQNDWDIKLDRHLNNSSIPDWCTTIRSAFGEVKKNDK